jgi:hypothetical protein
MNQLTVREQKLTDKKIATLLTKLPRDEFLMVSKTQDQLEEFFKVKWRYLIISGCWRKLKQTGDAPDFIDDLSGKDFDFYWELTLWFDDIWRLVVLAFPEIKQFAKANKIKFPFRKELDFFTQILIFDADNQLEPCQYPYFEVSPKKRRDTYQTCSSVLSRKDLKLNAIELKRVDSWLSQRPDNPWMKLAMAAWCNDKRSVVQLQLRQLVQRSAAVSEKIKVYKKDERFYRWQNGEKLTL